MYFTFITNCPRPVSQSEPLHVSSFVDLTFYFLTSSYISGFCDHFSHVSLLALVQ